ncbi:hypothetical protein DIPPA_25803 [Diplonema papillatum]|nr:hypothetical protein DIPPA_25803 [Diplonema papillatum]
MVAGELKTGKKFRGCNYVEGVVLWVRLCVLLLFDADRAEGRAAGLSEGVRENMICAQHRISPISVAFQSF